jgi:RNA polymerase sigma-70 factor (ECF subfamily)
LASDIAPQTVLSIDELYQAFESGLRRYAGSLARDSDKANDLVQETFLRALAHLALLGQLNPYQRKAWLYRTLKNRFIDELRAQRREQTLLEQIARANILSYPVAVPQDVFAQLPRRYQELLEKVYILGMTSEEIGTELGVPAATVRSRLRLAIKWLRAHPSNLV